MVALVLLADHLANSGLPLALLVARDPPELAARLLVPLALPPQVLYNLFFCDLWGNMQHQLRLQNKTLRRAGIFAENLTKTHIYSLSWEEQ